MKPLISIITSAYNAGETLERTIKSVLGQTYENFEYIIVNHGSTDNTQEIISYFVEHDSRIKTINMEQNTGFIGKALNKGLEVVKGEYFCVLDADDCYKKDFLEKMLNICLSTESDVAMCSFKMFRTLESPDLSINNENNNFFMLENIEDYYNYYKNRCDSNVFFITLNVWWNKLYKTSYILQNCIKFSETEHTYGDISFTQRLYNFLPKLSITEYTGIYWYQSPNSTSKKYKVGFYREILNYLASWRKNIEIFFEKDVESKKKIYKSLMPEFVIFYLLANSDSNIETILNEGYNWISSNEMKQFFLSNEEILSNVNKEFEFAIRLLKNKYFGEHHSTTSVHEYYSSLGCYTNENFDKIFESIFDEENTYSIGTQWIIDYIMRED